MNRHRQAVLQPERDGRLLNGNVAGYEAQPPLLRDCAHDEHELHPRERLADAPPGAAAERKVGELRERRLERRCPAIGREAFRIRKVRRLSLGQVRAQHDQRPRRDSYPSSRWLSSARRPTM